MSPLESYARQNKREKKDYLDAIKELRERIEKGEPKILVGILQDWAGGAA